MPAGKAQLNTEPATGAFSCHRSLKSVCPPHPSDPRPGFHSTMLQKFIPVPFLPCTYCVRGVFYNMEQEMKSTIHHLRRLASHFLTPLFGHRYPWPHHTTRQYCTCDGMLPGGQARHPSNILAFVEQCHSASPSPSSPLQRFGVDTVQSISQKAFLVASHPTMTAFT